MHSYVKEIDRGHTKQDSRRSFCETTSLTRVVGDLDRDLVPLSTHFNPNSNHLIMNGFLGVKFMALTLAPAGTNN